MNIKCTEKEIELFMFFFKLLSRLIDIFSDLHQTQEDILQLWNFCNNFYLKKTQGKVSRLESKCILKGEFFYSRHYQKNFLNVFLARRIIYDDSPPLFYFIYFKETRHGWEISEYCPNRNGGYWNRTVFIEPQINISKVWHFCIIVLSREQYVPVPASYRRLKLI